MYIEVGQVGAVNERPTCLRKEVTLLIAASGACEVCRLLVAPRSLCPTVFWAHGCLSLLNPLCPLQLYGYAILDPLSSMLCSPSSPN